MDLETIPCAASVAWGEVYPVERESASGQPGKAAPFAPSPRLSFPATAFILHTSSHMGNGETTVEKESGTQSALDLPWNVVVHNDPVNLMSYVTMVFQRVLGFSKERARKHMLEVHQKGRSIVWTGVREPAESYVEQLQAHLLLATLEKSE